MSELRDSFIKLFGKTIAFPPNDCVAAAAAAASDQNLSSASDSEKPEQELEKNQDNSIDQEEVSKEHSDEPSKDNQDDDSSEKVIAKNNDNPKTPSADVEASLLKTIKNGEEDEGDDKGESDAQDKTLKKPDKILPCPRCTSMDTKFCYYNNYNVNQPRHFCKNCQRYWTAGGTMRNVPVGAGRRKNKNATTSSHYRHVMVSEALQMARMTNNAVNGSVLTFGSDEKSQHRVVQNVFLRPDDDHSSGCGSSVTASNSSERVQESTVKCFPPQVQCFPGLPWPCPWNSVQYQSPIPQAAYPVPFYPPYWGCTVPGSWNVPLAPPNPTVLGKHSRDGKEDPTSESNSGRSVLIPKTLRIDDPSEAAKSSIWATLGIRNEKTSYMNGGGLFKSFQSGNDKDQAMGASAAMHANPAALSRSLNFQENT